MGQRSASPFMNIRDGTERRVSFSARDELGDKIDKLTVATSRLAAKDNHEKGPFKPQIYKSRGLLTGKTSRIGQVIGIEDRTQVVGLDKTIEIIVLEETLEDMEDKIVEEDIEMIDIMITIEAETGQAKGYLQEIIIVAEIEVQVTVDPGQVPELIQTEIG